MLKQNNLQDWAFITAWNPYSTVLSEDENNVRHQKLLDAVYTYKYFEGEGIGSDSNWPPEKSLLVLGIDEETARELGNRFQQNAIVVGRKGTVAELKVLV